VCVIMIHSLINFLEPSFAAAGLLATGQQRFLVKLPVPPVCDGSEGFPTLLVSVIQLLPHRFLVIEFRESFAGRPPTVPTLRDLG